MTTLAEQPPAQAPQQEREGEEEAADAAVAADATTATTTTAAAEADEKKDDVEMEEAPNTTITTTTAEEENEEKKEEKNEEEKEKEEEKEEEPTNKERYDPKEGPKILANVSDLPRSAAIHMTEQQKYALRQQIASYAHICQQLLQLTHEAAQRDVQLSARGEYDTHHASSSYKEKQPKKEKPHKDRKTPASIFSNTGVYSVPGKVRWQPTTAQFERLEQMFAIDTTTPQREHLKQVTEELSMLGPIAECNVYNWFQNKKARLKKREQDAAKERMEAEMKAKAELYNAQQQQANMGNLS